MPYENNREQNSNANFGGISSDIALRQEFDDRLGQAISKLKPDQRQEFESRIKQHADTVLNYDATIARTFDQRRNNEELRLHREQNDHQHGTSTAAPKPPLMTNAEMQARAHDNISVQVHLGQARIDLEVRNDINMQLERHTGMRDALPESFKPSEQIQKLDQMLASQQARQDQEMEQE